MKLLRYGPLGQEKPGLLDAQNQVRDLSALVDDIAGDTLLPHHLQRLRELDVSSLPKVAGVPQHELRLGCCVAGVGKIVCIGLNYADHAVEAGLPVPTEPVLFAKWTSALSGPDDPLQLPRGSTQTDWEVELAVVIGQGGRYIDEADAMQHVAGYCIMNDVSERSFQLHRGGTWDKGKGCDSFAPLGPWLVTTDEIANPHDLHLWLDVDQQRYQDGSTQTMVFKLPYLIHYLSQFMSLQSGDVISTGTPPGVGMGHQPPVYLRAGQTVRLGVQGLGVQTQRVLAS